MNVRIVDTISRGSFHEIFNASLLTICLTAFERVEYICHSTQQRALRDVLTRNRPRTDLGRVHFRTTSVIRREGPLGWFCKYLLGAMLNLWYLITVPRHVQLIYTYNNPLALWPVNLVNKVVRRRVIVVCHGELELLHRHPAWYKAARWFKWIMRRAFGRWRIEEHIRFCVLGDSILRHMQPYLSVRNRLKVFSMDHPYFFSQAPATPVHDTLHVGSVGQLMPGKGLNTLLALSRNIPVPLSVVGRAYGFRRHADYPNVRFVAGTANAHIPRERYDAEIAELDYILFAYNPAGYKLTASGALFDALNMGRPVITLRNDYFDEVMHLPMGYVVKDAQQMADLVRRLAAEYPANPDYEEFLSNIVRLRAYYEVEAVAERFRRTLATLYSNSRKNPK